MWNAEIFAGLTATIAKKFGHGNYAAEMQIQAERESLKPQPVCFKKINEADS